MRRRTFMAAIGGTALAGFAGCSGTSESGDPESGTGGGEGGDEAEPTERESEPPEATATATETGAEWVTVLDHNYEATETYDSEHVEDRYAVVGSARNDHDVALSIFINVVYLDADGVQIDDSTDHADDVTPGRTFAFEAPFLGDDPSAVSEYELAWEAYEA